MFPVRLTWEEEGTRDPNLRHIPGQCRSEKGFWWASRGWKLVGSGFSCQCKCALEAAFGKLIADRVYTSVGQPVSGHWKGQLGRLSCCIALVPRMLARALELAPYLEMHTGL